MKVYIVKFQYTDDTELCETDDEFGYIPPMETSVIEADSEDEAIELFIENFCGYRVEIFSVTESI